MIKNWSYTKLIDFEQCPYRVKLKHIDRLPEAKAPAAERGTQIHQYAEDYVCGKLKKLPGELAKFSNEFEVLRSEYKQGHVSLEGEWGFDKNWMPTDYKTAWLRVKGDTVVVRPDLALVVDYKTGQSYGKEVTHGEQVQLYSIATFIRNPDLEKITVELWYLDKDELRSTTYTRAQALRYVQTFAKRAERMLSEKIFPANPNLYTCKWCSFGPQKGGQCEHGVADGHNPMTEYRRKFG